MKKEVESGDFAAFNYCISFMDLLGQRNAARGQGLLPIIKSDSDDRAFRSILRNTIGPIFRLQRDVEAMVSAVSVNRNSPLRMSLSEQERVVWDEMVQKRVETQHWSDGFVTFVCLGDQDVKCPLNGIFEIFGRSGSHCLFGLAQRSPMRGAIDIAWGVELRPGELYGPVVASAYELESEVAQYPRVVVGHRVIEFLEVYRAGSGNDSFSQVNSNLAKLCLDMLFQDTDGHWCVDYLGVTFEHAVTHEDHSFLCEKARTFVIEQLEEHRASFNSKLAFRYSQLLSYFDSVPRQRTG